MTANTGKQEFHLQQSPFDHSQMQQRMLLVGIGASAGGIKALQGFLQHVDPAANCAYIIVQHLSPHFKSMMAGLLQKHANLPIHTAENNTLIEPQHVYITPPGKQVSIEQNRLKLYDQDTHNPFWFPVDTFFESMAHACGTQCAGVVLSGAGSDGSYGGRLIKAKGGLFIAQQPDTAKFDGMPRNAIRTGLVDQVLKVEMIPDSLSRYQAVRQGRIKTTSVPARQDHIEGIDQILTLLQQKFRLALRNYQPGFIIRRIEHRMAINLVASFQAYADLLSRSAREASALHQDMLVGVKHFFRDASAYDGLKKILPGLFARAENRTHQNLRVWVAGCSTGEEACSIAMLLHDHAIRLKHKHYNIKVFATDEHMDALAFATTASYPGGIAADVPRAYLNRYFIKEGERYRVTGEIREMMVFAHHDLIHNIPYSNIDLVCCRNVIDRFKLDTQQQVLRKLANALNPGGYLFLGTGETLGQSATLFTRTSQSHNVYRFIGPAPALTASYKKLQFSNEKIATASKALKSKEEALQNAREELVTINAEYHARVKEITQLKANIKYVLGSMEAGTILLDHKLNVRAFLPGQSALANLSPAVKGRPFATCAHQVGELNLLMLARESQAASKPVTSETFDQNGTRHLVRVAPREISPNLPKGIVITCLELTDHHTQGIQLKPDITRHTSTN